MEKLKILKSKSWYLIELTVVFLVTFGLSLNAIKSIFLTSEIILIIFYILFCFSCFLLTYYLRFYLSKGSLKLRIIYMMVLAFTIRIVVLFFIHLTQQGDYSTYLGVAEKIYKGEMKPNLYYGIFPHALNYPIFISIFYKFFSNITSIPKIINLLLGVLEVGFAVGIGEVCINYKFGLLTGLLTLMNPSLIIFTLLTGGETIYDSLIMGALFFFLYSYKKKSIISGIFIVLSGIFCAIGDFFRPTGIIFIFSVFIFIILDKKILVLKKIKIFFIFLIVFIFVSSCLGNLTNNIRGYKKPTLSFGWNLYIGANYESKGKWNIKDAKTLAALEKSVDNPSEIQEYYAKKGLKRYIDMKFNIIPHFINKLYMWFDESYTANCVSGWQNKNTIFKTKYMASAYKIVCYSFNFIIIFLAFISVVFFTIYKNKYNGLKLPTLYILGSVLLFMILESALRYKGAYYCMFTLLGSYGAILLKNKIFKINSFKFKTLNLFFKNFKLNL